MFITSIREQINFLSAEILKIKNKYTHFELAYTEAKIIKRPILKWFLVFWYILTYIFTIKYVVFFLNSNKRPIWFFQGALIQAGALIAKKYPYPRGVYSAGAVIWQGALIPSFTVCSIACFLGVMVENTVYN